ncbi:MAG: glycoside hydrolase family 2 TIM barrel-domain containing protein [Acutalibacteraceae bacterium]|nr:glycoside hydrolase family 2 TIM barrel-domain containing protein [Acutalibacteraceae bacterium]
MLTLKTRWADAAMCDMPLPEYPRPQMVRDCWMNLNGFFDFAITDEDKEWCDEFEEKIRVPFAVESCLSGVCKRVSKDDALWYRKKFNLGKEFTGKRIILHFEAVDWETKVYVNGIKVGEHIGGYCPFSFDITDMLKDGENELTVRAWDPTDGGWQNRGKQASESHGFWYTSTSGIWQTVWLEGVCENYIESYRITPDIDESVIEILPVIKGEGELKVKVLDGDSVVYDGAMPSDGKVKIPSQKLWSPESPFLYDFVLTLTSEKGIDEVKGYFGMRKFSIGAHGGYNRLFLNNEPYFQKGLLDQGYWSDGGMTPPTEEAMIYDIQTMKDLGFNMLRKHIKVESHRWYYLCDKIGMLVWQDMVSGGKALNLFHAGVLPNIHGTLNPIVYMTKKDNTYKTFNRDKIEWRLQFEEEYEQMIDNLYNFTSICCWVPFNEGWGQFDAKRIGDWTKQKDPTRFCDHASGWYDQKGADFRSMHKYILPVILPKYDGRPIVLSEFGGYSHNIHGHVWNYSKSFGYQMYKSKDALTEAYRKLHEHQIIPNIKRGLSATVYTQVSDVEFEVNGMLSYDRELIKLHEDVVKNLNAKMTY